jgi:hypothetical protein
MRSLREAHELTQERLAHTEQRLSQVEEAARRTAVREYPAGHNLYADDDIAALLDRYNSCAWLLGFVSLAASLTTE